MATSTTASARSIPSTETNKRGLFGRFELSPLQVIATGFAAVTATFLASYLGVSGTIIGAALVSMTTAIGNAVYGKSLRSTRDKVREAVPFGKADPASPTGVVPAPGADGGATDAEPQLPADRAADVLPARAWRRVAIVAVAMFAGLLAIVTSVELLAGRPLSDVVRGESGHGTSIGGGGGGSGSGVGGNTGPVMTTTVTVTPKVVVTTPTVTQTAPAKTTTTTPPTTTTTTTGSSSTGSTTSKATPAPSTSTSPTLPRPGE